jgi:hypothetical protein
MSLIQCPECKNEISDKAIYCPQCGYPIAKHLKRVFSPGNENKRNKAKIFLPAILIFLSAILIMTGSFSINQGKPMLLGIFLLLAGIIWIQIITIIDWNRHRE